MATRSFTFILFFFFFFNASAQKFSGFSKILASYPTDIRSMYGKDLQKEDEDLFSKFSIKWRSSDYDSLEKKKILDLSVLMYEKKCRLQQFKQLISLLIIF